MGMAAHGAIWQGTGRRVVAADPVVGKEAASVGGGAGSMVLVGGRATVVEDGAQRRGGPSKPGREAIAGVEPGGGRPSPGGSRGRPVRGWKQVKGGGATVEAREGGRCRGGRTGRQAGGAVVEA